MSVQSELRRLPSVVGVVLVGLAVIVLAVRVVALVVAAVADGVERAETAVSAMAGTLPLGTRVVIVPDHAGRAGGAR